MVWMRRTIFTYRLKNPDGSLRDARGLYWKKETYREWFEWAKMSGKYPNDLGNLDLYEFDDWWKHPNYGFELFCEPAKPEPLEVVSNITNQNNYAYLQVDLTADEKKLERMFQNFIKKNSKKPDVKSYAKYQPIRHQQFLKLNSYKRYRRTYVMREIEGKSRGDVIEDRMPPKPPHLTNKEWKEKIHADRNDLDFLRSVSREVRKAKLIIKNVEKGRFPYGKP